MRHYEIVFLVHPDQSDQTQPIIERLSKMITESGGQIHRVENIGSRKLAYPIQDQFKASYALMNIECDQVTLKEIKNSFEFNDFIIRELILLRNKAFTDLSALSTQTEEEDEFQVSLENKDNKNLKSSVSKASNKEVKNVESKEVKEENKE